MNHRAIAEQLAAELGVTLPGKQVRPARPAKVPWGTWPSKPSRPRRRKPDHRLSEVDLGALLARCAVCGPVAVVITKKGGPICRRGQRATRYLEKYGISISEV